MAEMKMIVQRIERIEEHPNADRLQIAFTDTFDWPVIIGLDSFKPGDKVVHFPVDCVIPPELEDVLLGDSKIKLSKGRIRAAKIRKIISYGILAPVDRLQKYHAFDERSKDLMKGFGCIKYEPPTKKQNPNNQGKGKKTKRRSNRNFSKYFDMNHLQNCKGIFNDDDIVIITEKLHGTSFRAGWVKRDISALWDKIKLCIRRLWDEEYEWEFVYGSRNVQLQHKLSKKGFYAEDVYTKMVNKYNLKSLPKGIVIYAEIVGPGIQKNYEYTKDHEMFVYDIKENREYVDHDYQTYLIYSKENQMSRLKLRQVPLLYFNIWGEIKNNLYVYFEGDSLLDEKLKVKEGIVIESIKEEICRFGRKKVKVLNPEYLLNKTNTDFH